MRYPRIFRRGAAAFIVLTTFAAACSSSASSEGDVGSGPEAIEHPTPVTSGTYRSDAVGPGAASDAEARGNAAVKAAEEGKAMFQGWLNGMYVFPDYRDLPKGARPDPASRPGSPCGNLTREATTAEVKASPQFVTPTYLPPGAYEITEPEGHACGDQIVMVGRQYQLQPSGVGIGIVRRVGTKLAQTSAPRDRIEVGRVNGHAAILVPPYNEEGFGNSTIFILDGDVLTQVGGLDLRFDELKKIAEGLR